MDATFWAFIALIIFLAIIAYVKVPAMIGKSLDDRADKIKSDLDDARRLREEAQELLADYQRKRKEAEQEASEILTSAKREAAALEKDAEVKANEFIARRTALAEQKIEQAQAQAIAEVRASAVDIAVAAAGKILEGKVTGAAADKLITESIADVKASLN
ncbi:MAG: F0F1 ATP synthase subunit B [Salaquimonas sp.]